MSDWATCLACGITDKDVRTTLIEVEHPERTVTVHVPVTHRDGAVEMPIEVPERYYSEPRCRDRDACRLRELALAPVAAPVERMPETTADTTAAQEEDEWLRI